MSAWEASSPAGACWLPCTLLPATLGVSDSSRLVRRCTLDVGDPACRCTAGWSRPSLAGCPGDKTCTLQPLLPATLGVSDSSRLVCHCTLDVGDPACRHRAVRHALC